MRARRGGAESEVVEQDLAGGRDVEAEAHDGDVGGVEVRVHVDELGEGDLEALQHLFGAADEEAVQDGGLVDGVVYRSLEAAEPAERQGGGFAVAGRELDGDVGARFNGRVADRQDQARSGAGVRH
jgi:hypothetical protein